jgi:DNA-directed RNA polymerase specialized sigma24 family protein
MASFGGGRRGTPHGNTSNPADDELAAAVARLPAAQREVVSLKNDGGLT